MFLPTYDTHECTVDKLDLVLKNLEKNPVTQIHDRSRCSKQARKLQLSAHENVFPVCPSLIRSLCLTLSPMAPSEAAAEPAQWLAAVEAVLPWRMA